MKTKQTHSVSPKDAHNQGPAEPPAYRQLDAESVLDVQRRAVAAAMTTTQKLLQEMQEMSIRQFTLFGQALQQVFDGGYGVLQATNFAEACDHCAKCSQAITETTLQSVHEAVTATCKCSSDALSAFHGQMVSSKLASAEHPAGSVHDKAAA